MGVNNENSVGQSLHGLDTAVGLLHVEDLLLQTCNLLLGEQIEGAVLLHLVQTVQAADGALDGLVVGQHTAGPTNVDIVLAAALSLFLDGLGCLLLGTDEQNGAALSGEVTNEVVGLLELLHGLLQVDDVDAVSLGEDVLLHLGVPAAGVVTEVDTGLQQLLDGDDRHFYVLLLVFPPQRHVRLIPKSRFRDTKPTIASVCVLIMCAFCAHWCIISYILTKCKRIFLFLQFVYN